MRRIFEQVRAERGQSLIELTLVLPFLLLIMVAALDLGRAYYVYVALTNAAREGARYGASNPSNDSGVRSRVQKEVENSNLSIPGGQIPAPVCYEYVEGSTDFGASISCDAAGSGDYIVVTVNYPFRLVTGYVLNLNTINLSQSATMAITR